MGWRGEEGVVCARNKLGGAKRRVGVRRVRCGIEEGGGRREMEGESRENGGEAGI